MKFRFQVNGIIEFGGDMSMAEITEYISKQLVGSKLTGITIFEMKEEKVPTGRQKRHYVRLADRDN